MWGKRTNCGHWPLRAAVAMCQIYGDNVEQVSRFTLQGSRHGHVSHPDVEFLT